MGTVRAERAGTLRHEEVRAFIAALYEGELHTKRVTALAGATLGVMASASLAVAVIGQALAQARSRRNILVAMDWTGTLVQKSMIRIPRSGMPASARMRA